MKKITINKEKALRSLTKMIADKNAVQLFLKDKTSIEDLKQKGISLVNPL
ncbi:hypothetical protein SD960_21290 [Flavobacterium sp. MMLR14_040]|jgi:hypothetical protein|nr:hypothetical protein [Flavobacterium sp. MMLR14_040]MDW8852650.1 hypothetical protein [Flavobacterium sp. MMLR14_040]